MFRLLRNNKIAAIATVGVLIVAGGAYAFWTAGGTGSATSTASGGGTITINGTIPTGIAPGLSRTVTFQATNTTTSAIMVQTVSLTSVTVDAGHSGCLVADFTMPSVVENESVAAGASAVSLTNTGTLTMANTAVNQDACKGATLTLALAST